ncbi:hypothetical protein BpHYR1_007379 [Brachionus plicatilis]|uniref:Uncharacterized protein n=1 Tax=Brachionus plicatilis TaxID=10195 RepID=A0A3M7P2L7_BRAPC|nr:hypothetical protein BpHYR1_007379 [Brachionus plicatilis]
MVRNFYCSDEIDEHMLRQYWVSGSPQQYFAAGLKPEKSKTSHTTISLMMILWSSVITLVKITSMG